MDVGKMVEPSNKIMNQIKNQPAGAGDMVTRLWFGHLYKSLENYEVNRPVSIDFQTQPIKYP